MGMTAEVFAIGPFSRRLLPFMEYDDDKFTDVPEGVEVIISLFHDLSGSSQSRAVAVALGFDPWDFRRHAFDGAAVDLPALKAALLSSDLAHDVDAVAEVAAEVERFVALRTAGFRFYFRPNG